MMAITKYMQIVATILTLALIVNADIDKDTEQCASQVIGLSTCLPYVQGKANSPTLDCCSGLKQVLQKNKICLCILVKDRDDPKLGFKINATLALSLPQSCNAPSDVKECPSLLHLAPGSPDAKVFEDFVKSSQGTISTPTGKENGTSDGSSGAVKSESGRLETKWLGGHQMLFGLFLFVFLLNYRSN